ncbi:MAG: NAD(P)/FAD-dependent oxidoreductase [Lachnospiraceae bacterium]|nr:NAD(P)/FAD-dependent oxidoreductase [Lachnospiraceae bacterium]
MKKIVVIGGGAAGMFFSIFAAKNGHQVTLIEKNEKLGKKLFITGKGRCNFTNQCSQEEFLSNVVTNPKFLYSAIAACDSAAVIRDFEDWGMPVKVERGNRAFPASDHSSDVIKTLEQQMKKQQVEVRLFSEAKRIVTRDGCAAGVVICRNGSEELLEADAVVIATGGLSYPSTGSTGDGYRMAEETGHRVTECRPSLVPIICSDEYCRVMQGLFLKNVSLVMKSGKKIRYTGFGEMMFTHFGITGPLVLSASAKAGAWIGQEDLNTWIDLKPALSEEMLENRLIRMAESFPNKDLINTLGELYPAKMVPVIPELAGVNPRVKMRELTRKERLALIRVTKQFPLHPVSLRGYQEAVVTKGGVSVKDVNPKTMESKKTQGIYLIGEVLDLDAYTGGFNLQIAWATAYAAAEALKEDI